MRFPGFRARSMEREDGQGSWEDRDSRTSAPSHKRRRKTVVACKVLPNPYTAAVTTKTRRSERHLQECFPNLGLTAFLSHVYSTSTPA
jgi:hypothetical protein